MYELYRRISNLQKEMNIHKLQGGNGSTNTRYRKKLQYGLAANSLRKNIIVIVICCLLLLGVGYFVKTGFKYMQVVGKWTDSYSNGETVAEFFWDGTCIIDDFTGTYSLKNGKMYLVSNNYRKSGVMFYEKNGNVLILSEENGDNSTLLIRVK